MDATESSVENDIHHFTPLGIAHIANGFFTPERCIVHENIDTPEAFERRIGERRGGFFLANIAEHGGGLAPTCLDLAHDTLGLRSVRANIDDHRSASPRQRERDCPPDIASGTGDDGDLAGKLLVTHQSLHSSCPALCRHPRLLLPANKTWMAGTCPAMTESYPRKNARSILPS